MLMDDRISKSLDVLFSDLKEHDTSTLPLLAHYTSYTVLESILKHEEFWLSNPLFMNDLQEVRFGVQEGLLRVLNSTQIKKMFKNEQLYQAFLEQFHTQHAKFANEHVLDTYVFCLTEHDQKDYDGRLSMWRGYGSNASGACIVLNPREIAVDPDSPFYFSDVTYASYEEQTNWIDGLIGRFCEAAEPVQFCEMAPFYLAWYLFERIKLFALFTKHKGFSEEQEWRLVYTSERDVEKKFAHMIGYWTGPRGPEPKLKLTLRDMPGFAEGTLALDKIVDRLILGPTNSSPLSQAVMHRVLVKCGQSALSDRIYGSGIPYRAVASS